MLRRKKNVLDMVVDDIKYVNRVVMGGPDEKGLKLIKLSGFFLVVPDPTMISTSIGVTMLTTGKLLSRRRKKGLKDHIDEFMIEYMSMEKLLEKY